MLYGDYMYELIKRIRESTNMSQDEMGKEIGVSFATINRWENNRAFPNHLAQEKIYDFCINHGVSLYQFILDRIESETKKIVLEENRILLFHGSKSGIVGDIAPISRDVCDFGKGFYMGNNLVQPLTLICDFPFSKLYIVSIKVDDLNIKKIPPDINWAMVIAYNRGRMEKIKGTEYYNYFQNYLKGYDLVIGSIANDIMFFVLDNFFSETITDMALLKSLKALNLGSQYVAITQKGCNKIRIEKEIKLSGLERKCIKEVSLKNRTEGIEVANKIFKDYRREGKFFDEILDIANKEKK